MVVILCNDGQPLANAFFGSLGMKPISTSQALHLLAETFDEPVDRLAPATARDAIAGWDSMGALSLMAELDERFNIELTAEASRAMARVADVIELLRRHGALAD
jgi:acyl carrier protein